MVYRKGKGTVLKSAIHIENLKEIVLIYPIKHNCNYFMTAYEFILIRKRRDMNKIKFTHVSFDKIICAY
mgnify:CR=1 FL=1